MAISMTPGLTATSVGVLFWWPTRLRVWPFIDSSCYDSHMELEAGRPKGRTNTSWSQQRATRGLCTRPRRRDDGCWHCDGCWHGDDSSQRQPHAHGDRAQGEGKRSRGPGAGADGMGWWGCSAEAGLINSGELQRLHHPMAELPTTPCAAAPARRLHAHGK
jgi:hypothetical protein